VYRSILVAIDASATAQRALAHATELAVVMRARLTVLSVVAPLPSFAYRAGIDTARLEAEAQREASDLVRAAADAAPQEISVTTRVRIGHAGDEIVAQAKEGEHDLVVLGSRGRGRLASTVLGSVGGDVHFHLHVPLLVVHPAPEEDVG
jgi:nucleotide-binding universal stress UspA family protein